MSACVSASVFTALRLCCDNHKAQWRLFWVHHVRKALKPPELQQLVAKACVNIDDSVGVAGDDPAFVRATLR